jgi:hypothetical protein
LHYYGVLLLVPLCVAEAARSLRRKKVDLSVLVSILVGAASTAFLLPFVRAASEFRKYYYASLNSLTPTAIFKSYLSVLALHPFASVPRDDVKYHLIFLNRAAFAAILLVIVIAAAAAAYRLVKGYRQATDPAVLFLVTLSLLPCFGFVVARFTSHVLEARFVCPFVIGLAGLVGMSIESLIQNAKAERLVVVGVLSGICLYGVAKSHFARVQFKANLAGLTPQPALQSKIAGQSDRHVYFQEWDSFALATFYEPDQELRSRFLFVYSRPEEMNWMKSDHITITAQNLKQFTNLAITPYEKVIAEPGNHLFVVCGTPDMWLDKAIAASAAEVTDSYAGIGCDAIAGQTISVRFRR